MFIHPRALALRQQGVTLVVVLLFLLALTSIVLVSARSSLLGEALARNQLDEQVARQAAEAALRDAETDLLQMKPVGVTAASPVCTRNSANSIFSAQCRAGLCDFGRLGSPAGQDYAHASSTNQTVADPWWPVSRGGRWNNSANTKPSAGSNGSCSNFTGAVPLGTFTDASPLRGVSRQPEYLIERVVSDGGDIYRVTARGFGVRDNTEVVLQSYVHALSL
jgi:type IV pilus assembly protein PilX